MGDPIQFDYSLIIPFLVFSVGFLMLVAYVIVRSMRHVKRRTKNDEELLLKMDELIELQKKSNTRN